MAQLFVLKRFAWLVVFGLPCISCTRLEEVDDLLPPAYDLIVVGAGLTGSVVAGQLGSQLTGKRVLILEAGPPSHKSLGGTQPPATYNRNSKKHDAWPGGLDSKFTMYDVPGNYDYMQCWDRGCEQVWKNLPVYQCRILGGCGVMNGALTQVPPSSMFDTWPEGWKWSDMSPYYEKAEAGMPSTVSPGSRTGERFFTQSGDFLRQALLSGGFKDAETHQPAANGMGPPHVTARDGIRLSTANTYLPNAMKLDHVTLETNAEVVELLKSDDGKRVTHVKYNVGGSTVTAAVSDTGFVVMAAGAVNTPRLLLANGLGDPQKVGAGLSDHTIMSAKFKVPASFGVPERNPVVPEADQIASYLASQTGLLGQYSPTYVAYNKDDSSAGGDDVFDVEIFVGPSSAKDEVTVWFVLMRPTCSSATLGVDPSSHAAFFKDHHIHMGCEEDRKLIEHAVDRVKDLMLKAGATLVEQGQPSDMNHWAGSCTMAGGSDSCVDPANLMLRGMDNLAIVDASILPGQVWGHPAHTLHAMALKASDVLLAHFRSSQTSTDQQHAELS